MACLIYVSVVKELAMYRTRTGLDEETGLVFGMTTFCHLIGEEVDIEAMGIYLPLHFKNGWSAFWR